MILPSGNPIKYHEEFLSLGQPLWDHKNTKIKHKKLLITAAIFFFFLYLLWAVRIKEKKYKMRRRSVEYWLFKSLVSSPPV